MSVCLIAILSLIVGLASGVAADMTWSPLVGAVSMAGIAVLCFRTEDRIRNVSRDLAEAARDEADAVRRDAGLAHYRLKRVTWVAQQMSAADLTKLHVEYARGWRTACVTVERALGKG